MRNLLLTSAAAFGLAVAAPAFAQTTSTTTSPPAPNMSAGAPQPTNSLPPGAATSAPRPMTSTTANPMSSSSAGAAVGAGVAGPGMGTKADNTASGTTHPMHRATRTTHHRTTSPNTSSMNGDAAMTADAGTETGARPGHEPGVGPSEPLAHHASNIDRADTSSDIAPRLPTPPVGPNAGPEQYLAVARQAIHAHHTGEAQEALERAETRLLDRSTATTTPGADSQPVIDRIGEARRDLATRDFGGAEQAISMAMGNGGASAAMRPGAMNGMPRRGGNGQSMSD